MNIPECQTGNETGGLFVVKKISGPVDLFQFFLVCGEQRWVTTLKTAVVCSRLDYDILIIFRENSLESIIT